TRLASLSSSQIEAEYSQRHAIISEERSRQAEVIQDRIQGLRAATQNEYIKGLSAQIEDRREQLKALRADRQKELDALIEASRQMTLNASSELDTQRRSLQQQLANEQAYLKELRVKREKKIADAGFFSENSVKKEQNALVETQEKKVEDLRLALNKLSDSDKQKTLRATYNQDIEAVKDRYQAREDTLNQKIQALSLKLSKSLGAREKDIESVIQTHMKELARVEKKFQEQQGENEQIREKEFKQLSENDAIIKEL
ncbi:hypothetical protein, partial [Oleiphilus sp. HI0128]